MSPAHFAEHLAVLRTLRSAISLADLVQGLTTGDVPWRPVVVTFDDGYADNVETAKPLLEQDGIPATFFLATGAIGGDREFWWDELERVLLEPGELADVLDLRCTDWSYRCELGADARYGVESYRDHQSWRTWKTPPTRRHAMYHQLWQRLYSLPHNEKRALLDQLLRWAHLEPVMRQTHRLVSLDEAKQLGRTPSIEVGAHTVTHPALPELALASQREEVQQSKRFLEQVLNRPVTSFAYPHGHFESDTVSAVREAGFASACSTAPRAVSRRSDRLTLPRFQVLDWDGDEFRARVRAWQAADPDA